MSFNESVSFLFDVVDGGWVWVILGLCWVCSLTEKMVAGWMWVILLKDGCGCGSTNFVEGWLGVGMARRRRRVCEFVLERRGKEIITNVKRMNILLNKYVE